MVRKFRGVIGKRDELYIMDGQVNLDDDFSVTECSEEEKDTP